MTTDRTLRERFLEGLSDKELAQTIQLQNGSSYRLKDLLSPDALVALDALDLPTPSVEEPPTRDSKHGQKRLGG